MLGFLASTARQPPHGGFHARASLTVVSVRSSNRASRIEAKYSIRMPSSTSARRPWPLRTSVKYSGPAAVKALVAASSHSPRSFVITQVVTDGPQSMVP